LGVSRRRCRRQRARHNYTGACDDHHGSRSHDDASTYDHEPSYHEHDPPDYDPGPDGLSE
jgi:hypothetical protein